MKVTQHKAHAALDQKHFDFRSLSPALCNLWLLIFWLVSILYSTHPDKLYANIGAMFTKVLKYTASFPCQAFDV